MAKSTHKKSRRSTLDPASTASNKEICFVIMPFGGWLDDYYESIYCPAIQSAGMSPHRADDLYRPSTIVNDIWAYTRQAKLLLADLTGKNPNVFYELGLAHALAKPAILVSESMDDIPFDLRALRIIVYDKNHPKWGERLQEKVKAAIGEVLKSPQEAVLPAFLHVRESTSAKSVTPREKELIEIKQELDLLRREVRRSISTSEDERIGPDEAQRRIVSYLRRGMPTNTIIRRLAALGAPESWIRDEIVEYQARHLARPTASPSESPAHPAAGDPALVPPKVTGED